jgi:predicted O-linked N-acetylglucosamine transferase (SPINDLY family)
MLDRPAAAPLAPNFVEDAISRASLPQMEIGELLTLAEQIKALGQPRRAVDLYKTWIAFHPEHPLLHAVCFNHAVSLSEVQDLAGAINAMRETIRIKPDFYPPYINLGNALEAAGRGDAAVGAWKAVVDDLPSVTPDAVSFKTMALNQIGRVFEGANSDAAAEASLRDSLAINPDQPEAVQHWIALRQRQCKWPVFGELTQIKPTKLLGNISPLSLACYADDPLFQLANAHRYNKTAIGRPASFRTAKDHPVPAQRPEKLRIGYVSSDFREHAVGFSMTEVVELHDRSQTEIFTYYCGSVKGTDATQARTKAGTDHWCDISGMDDAQAARRIHADGIHILIDLNGYTKDARTKVFAMRPAPINVNWFGFPGTMGSAYHHYLVADPTIIPPDLEAFYSEKVLHLPCYQPNDRKRTVSPNTPTRASAGLPENAFVFCCLNGTQKLTPTTFQRWMEILRQVPDSVLWLLTGTPDTNERLQQLAQSQGIAPERLIFAGKKANPDHLARYVLADLFLDNMPYGAHTTAADSLWMGVPVVTVPGRSFASRVCASLVTAAGIPEMICRDGDDYVAKAVALATDKAQLAALKDRLNAGRASCRLFDTPALVRDLEVLYWQMYDDFASGNLPVPELTNLELYHEIGMELDLEHVELMNDDAWRGAYRDALGLRDAFSPLPADSRLWTK